MNSKADYSRKMIDELWLTLSMVLNAAVEDGLISINPAKSKRLRNPSTKKTIREALTSAEPDDIEAHLQDIPQLRDKRYVAMLLKFPARCEDIRGLQIKDFNFEEKKPSPSPKASPTPRDTQSSAIPRLRQASARC